MDIDQLSRALKDHEKRLNRIEAFMEKHGPALDAEFELDRLKGNLFEALTTGDLSKLRRDKPQFCGCGREHCRAPDCPSHKPDPMGR